MGDMLRKGRGRVRVFDGSRSGSGRGSSGPNVSQEQPPHNTQMHDGPSRLAGANSLVVSCPRVCDVFSPFYHGQSRYRLRPMAQFKTNRVSAATPLITTPLPPPAGSTRVALPTEMPAGGSLVFGSLLCWRERCGVFGHAHTARSTPHRITLREDGHSPRSLAESGVAGHIRVLECA